MPILWAFYGAGGETRSQPMTLTVCPKSAKRSNRSVARVKCAFIVLAAFAAMASNAGAAGIVSRSCADGGTTTKSGGGYRIDYCGTAVATLRIGKKTYVFHNGSCFDANGNGVFMFSGTEIIRDDAIANVVGGAPGLFVWVAVTKQGAGLVAYDGTHPLVAGNPNLIKTPSIGPSGQFIGRSKVRRNRSAPGRASPSAGRGAATARFIPGPTTSPT